jgi:chaperonin cofactor prefoldin
LYTLTVCSLCNVLIRSQALWSYQPTGVGPTALKELIQEMETMRKDIDTRKNQCNELKEATDALQHELDSQLQLLANITLKDIETLGNSIVILHQVPDKSMAVTANQVTTCKGQSKIIAERFNALHKKAAGILQRAGDVSHADTA